MSQWANVIGYGLHADRPAAGAPGALYCESDTGIVVRDNGLTWDTIAGVTRSVAFTIHSTAVDYTIPAAGYLVICTAEVTVTLPDAASNVGLTVEVFTGAFNSTLAAAGTDMLALDTTSTATYLLAEGGLTLRSDGAQWYGVGGW